MIEHSPLDLVEELRLRRWARLNYVPEQDRPVDLHPVALNEMQRRDDEERRAEGGQPPAGETIVPVSRPHFFDEDADELQPSGSRELHYF